jgi:hypothetical protein
MSKRAADILYALPLDQIHRKIIVSMNRRDKARDERLSYDYRVEVAVSEREKRDGENGEEEGWKVFVFKLRWSPCTGDHNRPAGCEVAAARWR